MDYKIFKLKSGEEIITNVKEFTKGKYIIERRMIFKTATMFDRLGRPYDLTMLKDWLVNSENKIIEIPKSHVAISFTPTADTQKMYDSEKARIDGKKKEEKKEEKKTSNSENLLEKLFGDIFGDIEKEIEKQTEEEISKLPSNMPLNDGDFNPDEYPDFFENLQDEKANGDIVPMVSISMLFPPEVIIDLLDAGLLDPKEVLKLVRKIEKMSGREEEEPKPQRKKAKKKQPKYPKLERLSDIEKKVDDEPEGCNWKDWQENVFDLLDGGSTGARVRAS